MSSILCHLLHPPLSPPNPTMVLKIPCHSSWGILELVLCTATTHHIPLSFWHHHHQKLGDYRGRSHQNHYVSHLPLSVIWYLWAYACSVLTSYTVVDPMVLSEPIRNVSSPYHSKITWPHSHVYLKKKPVKLHPAQLSGDVMPPWDWLVRSPHNASILQSIHPHSLEVKISILPCTS